MLLLNLPIDNVKLVGKNPFLGHYRFSLLISASFQLFIEYYPIYIFCKWWSIGVLVYICLDPDAGGTMKRWFQRYLIYYLI